LTQVAFEFAQAALDLRALPARKLLGNFAQFAGQTLHPRPAMRLKTRRQVRAELRQLR
jgi:hypothetical protein